MKEEKELNKKENQKIKPTVPGTTDKENKVAKFQNYIQTNSKLIIYVSVGIIVVTALFFLIKAKLESSAEENKNLASTAVSRILPYFQSGDYQSALYGDSTKRMRDQDIIGLVAIVDRYESTPQGKVAALYAGNSFLSLNKPEEAIKYFKIALDSKGEVVLQGANAGLGATFETTNNFEEAVKYYAKAAELSITVATKNRYQYYTAVCYEKKGDKTNAEKIYRDIISEGGSEFVGLSKIGLIRIGTIID